MFYLYPHNMPKNAKQIIVSMRGSLTWVVRKILKSDLELTNMILCKNPSVEQLSRIIKTLTHDLKTNKTDCWNKVGSILKKAGIDPAKRWSILHDENQSWQGMIDLGLVKIDPSLKRIDLGLSEMSPDSSKNLLNPKTT